MRMKAPTCQWAITVFFCDSEVNQKYNNADIKNTRDEESRDMVLLSIRRFSWVKISGLCYKRQSDADVWLMNAAFLVEGTNTHSDM